MIIEKTRAEVGQQFFVRTFAPITRHTLALYCGASGDTNPIHVDSDFAKASGFPDVFAHGMLAMAYLGVALEEAVPEDAVRAYSTKFLSVTQLGAEITCEATVSGIEDGLLHLDLVAHDQTGDVKLKGTASVNYAS